MIGAHATASAIRTGRMRARDGVEQTLSDIAARDGTFADPAAIGTPSGLPIGVQPVAATLARAGIVASPNPAR